MSTIATSSQPTPPPMSALPQLPVSKIRTSSTTSDASRTPSATAATPKSALRIPSKIGKAPSLSGSPSVSSPSIPTLASTQKLAIKAGEKNDDNGVRRSVSIANFPQPPKARKAGQRSSADTDLVSSNTRGAAARSESLRVKKLKTKASTGSLNQMYTGSMTPSLFNSSGDGKSISGSALRRQSSGLASLHSRPESRNSSAGDSYSTSATTFEDSDEKRQSEEHRRGRDSGTKHGESKGNVIVSVRVRPDAGGDKTSGKDFLVDGRHSLIAYKGREAGDYYYGKSALFSSRLFRYLFAEQLVQKPLLLRTPSWLGTSR